MTDALSILIIDDSEDDQTLYKRVLSRCSDAEYTVQAFTNGEEGLEQLKENAPSCVLLDYSLPGYNGVEILKRIREIQPFVPVIMLTGQGNEAVAVTAMQEGAQSYISKSNITSESLHNTIQDAVNRCLLEKRIHNQRAALEIFTHALAHDLKEPVRTIRSFLDIITKKEKFSGETEDYFQYISKAANRMDQLIDTVYTYTRLDGEKAASETCNLATVTEEVKENIAQLLQERKGEITYTALPTVYTNRTHLIQVMQNLICNALHYGKENVAVQISAEEHGNEVVISVSDNGPGVEKNDLEKIFQPFKRAASHDSEQVGMGMGLAICRKIVETYGGKIWCESETGKGATFRFTLPKYATEASPQDALHPAEEEDTSPSDEQVENQPPANILLVEDNEGDIVLTRIMLVEHAKLSCNLLVAHNGKEALEKLFNKTQHIDLMLLDINMPSVDGFEVLERMHADKELLDIPVVMCSTSKYDKDVERALKLGAIGYMDKPPGIEKLKTIIDQTPNLKLLRQNEKYTLFRAS